MTVASNLKLGWPVNRQGLSLGRDGYITISRDNGSTFFELETIRDISIETTWKTADLTTRTDGVEEYVVPVSRNFSITTEALFDNNDDNLKNLLQDSIAGDYILIGGFTSGGVGPLFWGFSNASINGEFAGLTKVSFKFNCVRFIKWYFSITSTHPISLCTNTRTGTDGGLS